LEEAAGARNGSASGEDGEADDDAVEVDVMQALGIEEAGEGADEGLVAGAEE
jgi:hypothetical protein